MLIGCKKRNHSSKWKNYWVIIASRWGSFLRDEHIHAVPVAPNASWFSQVRYPWRCESQSLTGTNAANTNNQDLDQHVSLKKIVQKRSICSKMYSTDNLSIITILCTFTEQNSHLQNMLNLISQCICYACLVYQATKDQLPSHPTLIALRAWSIADLSGLTRRLKLQNIEKVR